MSVAAEGPAPSPKRIASWQRLRTWEQDPAARRLELERAVRGSYLLSRRALGDSVALFPLHLLGWSHRDFSGWSEYRFVGLVGIAMVLGCEGIAVTLKEAAELLDFHPVTVSRAARAAARAGWIDIHPNYRPLEQGAHAQHVNCYTPGRLLRIAYQGYVARSTEDRARARFSVTLNRQIRDPDPEEARSNARARRKPGHPVNDCGQLAPTPSGSEQREKVWAPSGAHVCTGARCRALACIDARRESKKRYHADRRSGRPGGGCLPKTFGKAPARPVIARSDGGCTSTPMSGSSHPSGFEKVTPPPPEWQTLCQKFGVRPENIGAHGADSSEEDISR